MHWQNFKAAKSIEIVVEKKAMLSHNWQDHRSKYQNGQQQI